FRSRQHALYFLKETGGEIGDEQLFNYHLKNLLELIGSKEEELNAAIDFFEKRVKKDDWAEWKKNRALKKFETIRFFGYIKSPLTEKFRKIIASCFLAESRELLEKWLKAKTYFHYRYNAYHTLKIAAQLDVDRELLYHAENIGSLIPTRTYGLYERLFKEALSYFKENTSTPFDIRKLHLKKGMEHLTGMEEGYRKDKYIKMADFILKLKKETVAILQNLTE
ncbi:hypothetical protein ACFL35_17960, partial [Candidatus Riflebacteria bacterium]